MAIWDPPNSNEVNVCRKVQSWFVYENCLPLDSQTSVIYSVYQDSGDAAKPLPPLPSLHRQPIPAEDDQCSAAQIECPVVLCCDRVAKISPRLVLA